MYALTGGWISSVSLLMFLSAWCIGGDKIAIIPEL